MEATTGRRDAATFLSDRICDHLRSGVVPWRTVWSDAGVPTNMVSQRPFRGINVLLLAALGYEINLFVTAKQLEAMNGSIRPSEKTHPVMYYAPGSEEQTDEKKAGRLSYYSVYNLTQCVGIPADKVPDRVPNTDPLQTCEKIVSGLKNCPAIRNKDAEPYYDPLEDYINIPRLRSYGSPASYYSDLFHQLAHATGHHTRLDRMGLVQMSEYGCSKYTAEELVAEIVTNYLENYAGIPCPFVVPDGYADEWIRRFERDKYLIFNACALAQKAIDFIMNIVMPEVAKES